MLAFLVLVSVTVVTGQSLHQTVEYYVNAGFDKLDRDHDGTLTPLEYRAAFDKDDTNHDGIITLQEFKAGSSAGPYSAALFATYDHDNDGQVQLGVIYGLYEVMDTVEDNEISRHEFDTYYTKEKAREKFPLPEREHAL